MGLWDEIKGVIGGGNLSTIHELCKVLDERFETLEVQYKSLKETVYIQGQSLKSIQPTKLRIGLEDADAENERLKGKVKDLEDVLYREWTHMLPVKSGFYWFFGTVKASRAICEADKNRAIVVEYDMPANNSVWFPGVAVAIEIERMDGAWCGPIKQPY